MRLVLNAEVQNDKAHAARHSLPRLISLHKGRSAEQGPRLVRAGTLNSWDQLVSAWLFILATCGCN